MDLLALDGSRFSLSIAGYQFPGNTGAGPNDWDANWLNVSGALHLPDGRGHSFLDPCLTTWEAQDLATWLAAVGAGIASPAEDDGLPALTFTEPCVAFDANDRGNGSIELRIYLSVEAEPPFVVAGQKGMFTNYVPFSTTEAAVRHAASELRSELSAYPVRA